MSRREIVVLVSRALAIIEFVAAFEEVSHLPGFLMETLHETSLTGRSLWARDFGSYYFDLTRVDLFALIIRIACLTLLGIVLWECGPWIESRLLPAQLPTQPSAEPAD
jgi:hypothetical protein